jgi:hypothetical protein
MNTDSQRHFSNREWTRINANKSNSFVSIRGWFAYLRESVFICGWVFVCSNR